MYFAKPSGQMSPEEMKLAEEKYKAYMEGLKERTGLHISFDFGYDMGTMIRNVQRRLKDINVLGINCEPRSDHHNYRIILGGVIAGKSHQMHKMIKDLTEHGIAISIAKEGLSGLEMNSIAMNEMHSSFMNASEKMKELARSLKDIPEKFDEENLDEPINWLSPEPPKQKKARRNQPDKRALNRKNRKKK